MFLTKYSALIRLFYKYLVNICQNQIQVWYNLHGDSQSFLRILRAQLIQYRNYWSEKHMEQNLYNKNEEHAVLSVDFFRSCYGLRDNLKRIRHSEDRAS